jgi:hypothetical protein
LAHREIEAGAEKAKPETIRTAEDFDIVADDAGRSRKIISPRIAVVRIPDSPYHVFMHHQSLLDVLDGSNDRICGLPCSG